MYIKDNVSIKLLKACMLPALFVCYDYFNKINKEFTITSGNEGKHKEGSFHYTGEAFDLRSRDMSHIEIDCFIEYFRLRLDTCYDIIVEVDHIHVEYDENKIIEPWLS